ncbi:MAG: hypothetical protein JSW27_06240 [Phycisphaerales bacterium]|nr:MAG: hypothetical protein JSW27_06240 [Phycisphaerales bacterium]
MSHQQQKEPPVVAVYNNSQVGLRIVSLRAAAVGGELDRIGSVSPVPRGASQVFGRPTDAPPLPSVVELSWSDDRDRDYSRKVILEPILQQATGERGETLVFEIRPAGDLAVYCQTR